MYPEFIKSPATGPLDMTVAADAAQADAAQADAAQADTAPAVTEKLPSAAPDHQLERDILYDPYGVSQSALDSLRDLVGICAAKRIQLVLFIPPPQRGVEEAVFRRLHLWPKILRAREELARIHPYWDFHYPNSFTSNPDNYLDASHFCYAAGDKLLARMMSSDQAPFGVRVDTSNCHEHLAALDRYFARL